MNADGSLTANSRSLLADALVADYLQDLRRRSLRAREEPRPTASPTDWITAKAAAAHARVSVKLIYGAVSAGQRRAARVGARRDLRFRREWIDDWLDRSAAEVVANPREGSELKSGRAGTIGKK
jgi:hypothetical protein